MKYLGCKTIGSISLSGLLISSLFVIASSSAASESADVPCSDFNGDGYGDLAIGVPGEAIGSIPRAGAVNVLYGSQIGLRASASGTVPDDQFWHQNNLGLAGGAESGDQFGVNNIRGDYNDDGFCDLVISSFESMGSSQFVGSITVVYGSSKGLQKDSPGVQGFHQNKAGIKGDGAEQGDLFGAYGLATGDFNGDDYDDLATGVPRENVGSDSERGVVHVLYGSEAGLQLTTPDDQLLTGTTGKLFGYSLASADFDRDGMDDLAVGIPSSLGSAGSVRIFSGSPSGLDTDLWDTQLLNQLADSPEFPDLFGYSLSSADYDGDGYPDLAIGVPRECLEQGEGCGNSHGAVDVFYGSAQGIRADSADDDQFWHQDSPGVKDEASSDDHFGGVLISGDFNNDGNSDLAIAAIKEDINELGDEGALNVLYGSSSGLQADSPNDQFWHQDSPGVKEQAEEANEFGHALWSFDFNNDGYDDLAIGIPDESIGSANTFCGAVSVLYGSPSGLRSGASGTTPDDQLWHQNSSSVKDVCESGDAMGSGSAAALDI